MLDIVRQRVGIGRLRHDDLAMVAEKRQGKRDAGRIDRDARIGRRRQDDRPIGGRQRQAYAVTGAEAIAAGIEHQRDARLAVLLHWHRLRIAVVVRQVEDAEGDAGCRSVRMDIDDTRDEIGGFGTAGKLEVEHRLAEIVLRLEQRARVESERARIVDALVAGHLGVGLEREILTGSGAGIERRTQVNIADPAPGRGTGRQASLARNREGPHFRRAPDILGDPAARVFIAPDRRPRAVEDIGAHLRQLLGIVLFVAKPAVPPADRLSEKVCSRLRPGEMRIFVDPGADERLGLAAEPLDRLDRRVAVAVRPSGDHQRRDRKAVEILRDRAMPPEIVAALVLQPFLQEEGLVLEALQPHLPPALADEFRIGRSRLVGEHGCRPGELSREMAAVLVVDVVIVAVDGRGDRDHRLESRRLECRHLQTVEAAPGDAHHPDLAVRPGLCRNPFDDLAAVGEFTRGVFAVDHALGLARAADVDANAGNPGGREGRVGGFVACTGSVALAVGQVFQDGRHRLLLGALGHPDARGEPGPVLEGYPFVFDHGEIALDHVGCLRSVRDC